MTRKAWAFLGGKQVPEEDAKVGVMTHALHYGTSVFEGVRCYNTPKGPIVFRHREHAQRLKDSAKIYRFPIPFSVEEIIERSEF